MDLKEYCKGTKGLIFDYGATIDSGGEHWSEVILRGWRHSGLEVDKQLFRDAYVYAERELARVRHIEPHHDFLTLLRIKMRIEMEWLLREHPAEAAQLGLTEATIAQKSEQAAQYCDHSARNWVEKAKKVLDVLKHHYKMVLVSNFYGNVNAVLNAYGLAGYFEAVVESAVVGVRKPDPQIFTLGVDALGVPASETVVIGDSLRKDIEPALKAGCKAIWIKGKQWTPEEDAQSYNPTIYSLQELLAIVEK